MKKILLILGYLGGVLVAAKSLGSKKEKKEGDSFTRDAVDTISEVHKNMFDQVKDAVWTEENQELLNTKKDDAKAFVKSFREEAIAKMDEMKDQGIDILESGEDEVKGLYEKRVDYLQKAKDWGFEALSEAQESLEKAYSDVQKKITKK